MSIDDYEQALRSLEVKEELKTKIITPLEEFMAQKSNQNKVYTFILMSISDELYNYFSNVMTGYGYALWQALLKRFKNDSIEIKTILQQQLFETQMTETESFDEYLARINSLVIRLNEEQLLLILKRV
jgi:hypothetical protein